MKSLVTIVVSCDLHIVYSVPSIKQRIEGNMSNMVVPISFSIVDDKTNHLFLKKKRKKKGEAFPQVAKEST